MSDRIVSIVLLGAFAWANLLWLIVSPVSFGCAWALIAFALICEWADSGEAA